MKNRDWTPVRKGNIYCSPACGAKCKTSEYEIAKNRAEKLRKECETDIGGEWVTRVHENLGWHYNVYHKKSKISINYGGYLSKGDYYSVGLHGGTPMQISVAEKFSNVKDAWQAQVNKIKDELLFWKNLEDSLC